MASVRAVAAEPPPASAAPQAPETFADPLPVAASAPPGKAREPGDIQEELAELKRARSAQQRGHHLQALRSIEAHQRRYPRSIFSEEREALAVSALGKLDRTAEARARARAFARRYPRSVFVSKLSPWLAE